MTRDGRIAFLMLSLVSLVSLVFAACSQRPALSDANHDPGSVAVPDRPIALLLESESELSLGLSEPTTLRLRAMWTDDNTPAADRPVFFRLEGSTGGAFFEAPEVISSYDGRLENVLTSGSDLGSFTAVASTPGATDVRIAVVVDGVNRGKLRVTFTYDHDLPLYGITASVRRATSCPERHDAPLPPPVLQKSAGSVASVVIFEGVQEGQSFIVTATANTRTGTQATWGCAVAPRIVGRRTETVTLPLRLLPVSYAGTYDFATELHLTETIPGIAGDVIDGITGFFIDPANMLAQQIVNAATLIQGIQPWMVESAISAAWTAYALATRVPVDADSDGMVIDDAITHFLLDRMPDWVDNTLLIGGDISTLLANMTVGGTFIINEGDEDGNFDGRWTWNEFLFSWRYGTDCAVGQACCGLYSFTGDEMDLDPIAADFTGTVQPGDDVGIDLDADTPNATAAQAAPDVYAVALDASIPYHRLSLQYGNLVYFLLRRLALPAISGHDNIPDAVESLIGCTDDADPSTCGCGRVASWLDSLLPMGALGDMLCGFALEGVTRVLEQQIDRLNFSGVEQAHFNAAMEGALVDYDFDLAADTIDTTVFGQLVVMGQRPEFTGDMRGTIEHAACEQTAQCEDSEICRSLPAVLNPCDERQVCALADLF